MDKLRLLIADGTEDFAQSLSELLWGNYQICCCTDGNEARMLLEEFRPDILVLDLMLPGYDGLGLLQWAAGQNIRPVVLATSRFSNDYVISAAAKLGVGYVMTKPCNMGALAARVWDMSQQKDRCQSEFVRTDRISDILRILGLKTGVRGYPCLREAMAMMVADPTQAITKVIYPEVAKKCGCRSAHVERNIRTCIETAWKRRDDNVWRLYFQPDASGSVPKPSNGEFLSQLAHFLRNRAELLDGERETQALSK